MLLKKYHAKILNPTCNHSFRSVHCIARLDEDISEVLPYLNAVLGGESFVKDPPSVTFKISGKLITLHGRKIAVNALRDKEEAYNVLDWLKDEINEAWRSRESIVPKYDGVQKPTPLAIFRYLPRTNCRACGQPTCMAFAVLATEGARGADHCPSLDSALRAALQEYLSTYQFD